MTTITAMLAGFVLDLLIGDPEKLSKVHPVVLMGKTIRSLETLLRRLLPKTKTGECLAGACMAFLMTAGTWSVSFFVLLLLRRCCPPLAWLAETLWCWQALAVRDLKKEAMRVYGELTEGSLEGARKAVGRIVGRDTDRLSREGVALAAVETVAENFSDGVTAPLFYMALGGAPLALCYKAANTMDSMVGYRNECYLHFGHVPARLDDAANYLPSRLAAILLIASAGICGENAADAFRIWKRDRRKHPSPNAAQCESVMAGALGLRLCGPAWYFGKRSEKPFLGDGTRNCEPEDIRRACRMEYAGSLLALALLCFLRWILLGLI